MIDLNWLTLLLGLVLPMLVALVTNQVAAPGLKAVVLALLAALAGFLQALMDAGGTATGLDWNTVGSAAVTTFLIAVGAHYGLLKPIGLTGGSGVLQTSVPGGVGGGSGQPG